MPIGNHIGVCRLVACPVFQQPGPSQQPKGTDHSIVICPKMNEFRLTEGRLGQVEPLQGGFGLVSIGFGFYPGSGTAQQM